MLCFTKICWAVSTKVSVDHYAYLQGLKLIDGSIVEGDQQNIDVLIGSDYYFDVVSGDVIRGESSPIAVSSMFGWILSGHTSVEDSREKFATTNLIIERPKLMSMSRFDILSENEESSSSMWQTVWVSVRWWRVPEENTCTYIHTRRKEDTRYFCCGRKVISPLQTSITCV